MASLKHAKTAIGDDNPDRQVSVTHWNAEHTLTGTANYLLGFDGSGVGADINPATLTAAAVLDGDKGDIVVTSGAWAIDSGVLSTFGRSLASASTAAVARSTLGLGSAALLASTAVLQAANNFTDLGSVPTARTNLGLGSAALEAVSRFPITIATRALLAAYTATATAYLTESGREGLFVFDSSNLSAKVTSDTAQGVYIALSTDATGASGAWVRKFFGPYFLEWYGGDGGGVTDNAAALAALGTASAPCEVKLKPNSNYAFSSLVYPAIGVVINGSGRKSTTITITGTGGGAPSLGTNGGVQMFVIGCALRDVLVQYTNASLLCLINHSHATVTGRSTFERVDVAPGPAITAAQSIATAVWVGNLNEFVWREGHIGQSPAGLTGFKQDLLLRGFFNACRFSDITLQQHSLDMPNGIFNTAYPQLDMDHGTDGCTFDNLTFENGPNGAAIRGAGTFDGDGWYMADCPNAKNDIGWLPSQVVAQGDLIFPSASITGDSTVGTTINNASSTAALYVNQKIIVIGAGAAGVNLTARITAIVGSTLTVDTAMSTAVVGTGIYYGAYDSHGYICKTAGTTGSSPPAWPTTFQTEVADNTVTWKEHGTCAWIDANCTTGQTGKNAINLRGCYIGNNICGISAVASGSGTIGSFLLDGCEFELNNHAGRFDGAESVRVFSKPISYKNFGFEFLGRTQVCVNNYVCFRRVQTVANGADVVVTTNNANMAGHAFGNFNLTGLGKAKWFFSNTATAPASYTAPGSFLIGSVTAFNSSGVLQAASFPALTGDATTAGGALATTIATNVVTYAKFQQVAASSLVGNATGSLANATGITLAGGLAFSGSTLTAAGALTPTSVASTGAITSSSATAGIGYATGAGGAVSQITSRTTGVTLNKVCGAITLFSAAGSSTWATFTVTNSTVAATDAIDIVQKSGANLYSAIVTAVAAGSFNVSISAVSGTATEAPVFNFSVNKAVAA